MNVLLFDSRTGLLSFSFFVSNVLNLDIIQSSSSRIQFQDAFRSWLFYGIFNWKFLEILRRCLTLDRFNHVGVAISMLGVESWPFDGIYEKEKKKKRTPVYSYYYSRCSMNRCHFVENNWRCFRLNMLLYSKCAYSGHWKWKKCVTHYEFFSLYFQGINEKNLRGNKA